MFQLRRRTFILPVCFQLLLCDVSFHQQVELEDALLLERSLVDLQADQREDGQNEQGQNDDVTQTTNSFHQCADDRLQTYSQAK